MTTTTLPSDVATLLARDDHENVRIVQDRRSGLRMVIAVHSTVLGPALGGLRIRPYAGGIVEALDDALRLSRAMTLKAAAAGLDLGGGKAVVIDDGDPRDRPARLRRIAEQVDALGGAYITAEDIGTTTADMDLIAETTPHVVGRSVRGGIGGDPSPDTARTVLGGIRAGLQALDGASELAGRRVGVVGLGKVGGTLAGWLLDAGAEVVAYDPYGPSAAAAAARGATIVADADAVLEQELDVLAPCATGGLIDEPIAERLRCRIVCGAANNPLRDDAVAAGLAARGILYVPDFLANCGGLIRADAERRAVGLAGLDDRIAQAEQRTARILAEALASDRLPVAIAVEHAQARIATALAG